MRETVDLVFFFRHVWNETAIKNCGPLSISRIENGVGQHMVPSVVKNS